MPFPPRIARHDMRDDQDILNDLDIPNPYSVETGFKSRRADDNERDALKLEVLLDIRALLCEISIKLEK